MHQYVMPAWYNLDLGLNEARRVPLGRASRSRITARGRFLRRERAHLCAAPALAMLAATLRIVPISRTAPRGKIFSASLTTASKYLAHIRTLCARMHEYHGKSLAATLCCLAHRLAKSII